MFQGVSARKYTTGTSTPIGNRCWETLASVGNRRRESIFMAGGDNPRLFAYGRPTPLALQLICTSSQTVA